MAAKYESQKRATEKYHEHKTTFVGWRFPNLDNDDVIKFRNESQYLSNSLVTFVKYYMMRTKRNLILHGSEIVPCDIGKHRDEIHQAEQEIRAQLDTALLKECERCFGIDTPFYIILMEYLYRTDKEVFVP